jgi:hypothetical protein
MDGERFDSLIKRLGSTRVTRLTALRGLAAGAVASLTGISLFAEEGEAKDGKKTRRRRICHKTSATDPGVTKKLKAKRAKRHLRKHPFDTKGACTAVPSVGCQNNANCTGGQVCQNNICVDCTSTAQCSGNLVCLNGRCQAVSGACSLANPQGTCPPGQICGNGVCQTPVPPNQGCEPRNNTQGSCDPGQVCNIFGVCVPAVGCLNVANRQCNPNQFCCPSETAAAGECRGNLQAC